MENPFFRASLLFDGEKKKMKRVGTYPLARRKIIPALLFLINTWDREIRKTAVSRYEGYLDLFANSRLGNIFSACTCQYQ